MEPLILRFWTSVDVSYGFPSRNGQPYSYLVEVYMLFTSGVTPADLLMASMAESVSSTYLRAGIGGTRNWDLSHHRRTFYRSFFEVTLVTLINLYNLGKSLSCSKVMFSHAPVILFTGGCLTDTPRQTLPIGRHPPRQKPPTLGRHLPPPPPGRHPPTPPADGYCSGRNASYWNALLFVTNKSQLQ